jgi:hypothetical protein
MAACGGVITDSDGRTAPDGQTPLDASAYAKDGPPSPTGDDTSVPVKAPTLADAGSPTDGGRASESAATTPDAAPGTDGCVPRTCAMNGYDCGQNVDGCGGLEYCGSCTSPLFCGAVGFSRCGSPPTPVEHPATCQQLGYDCGAAGDGFGGLLDCGTCLAPMYCGGGGPGRCGQPPDAGVRDG